MSAIPTKSYFPLTLLKWLLVLLTGGIFGLFLLWRIEPRKWFKIRCPDPEADTIFFQDQDQLLELPIKEENGWTFYEYQCVRYFIDHNSQKYSPLPAKNWAANRLLQCQGLSQDQLTPETRTREGENSMIIPMNHVAYDVLEKLLAPYNIYQYLCCILWYFHNYQIFASVVLVATVLSGFYEVYMTREALSDIQKLAAHVVDVEVKREGAWKNVASTELLPGDLVSIPIQSGWKPPCDLVLISGVVAVDESSLTGEAFPVSKSSISDSSEVYCQQKHNKNTLFSGTVLMNGRPTTKSRILAVVTHIGFNTTKGDLIRKILTQPVPDFQYEKEARIFVLGLILTGILLFFVTLWLWGMFQDGSDWSDPDIWIFAFESIAVLVSPTLPLLFQIGLVKSASNLKIDSISTSNVAAIPISGKAEVMCFDKTGTLTNSDLDIIGVLSVIKTEEGPKFSEIINQIDHIEDPFFVGLSTCHEISKFSSDHDGIDIDGGKESDSFFTGPGLDRKMFDFVQGTYNTGDAFPYVETRGKCFEILKRFDFNHALQKMSVCIRETKTKQCSLYSKGSAEAILSVCNKSSIPKDLHKVVKHYSTNGCYIIALAYTPVDINIEDLNQFDRKDFEKDMTYLGLLLLRNEVRPDSRETVSTLSKAMIESKIITGDNIYTAFYIANRCGMVNDSTTCVIGDVEGDRVTWKNIKDSSSTYSEMDLSGSGNYAIGITSEAFEYLNASASDIFPNVLIFARMKPLQKAAIVSILKNSGKIVGMCGDGANDCAALRAAHFGIALSAAEASYVAPFSSFKISTSSVVTLISEGRACLATSFATFKFVLFYGCVMTIDMMLAFSWNADMQQWMYLIQDFVFFIPLAFFLVRSVRSEQLVGTSPTSRVFGRTTMFSFFGQLSILIIGLALTIGLLYNQDWYLSDPYSPDKEAMRPMTEVTSVWLVSNFIFVGCALVWSFGSNWRRPFFHNYGLVICSVALVLSLTLLLLVDRIWSPLSEGIGLHDLPFFWRLTLLMIGFLFLLIQVFYEKWFVLDGVLDWMEKKLTPDSEPGIRLQRFDVV